MSFGDTGILDAFSGTGALGGNWTTLNGSWTQGSGVAIPGGTNSVAGWNASTFGVDEEAYLTVSTKPGTGGQVMAFVRMTTLVLATVDAYGVYLTNNAGTDTIAIQRVDNAVPTSLTSTSREVAAGDKIGIRVIGNTITAWHYSGGAWAEVLSTTDSTYGSAGYIGMASTDTTTRIDDFGGGIIHNTGGTALTINLDNVTTSATGTTLTPINGTASITLDAVTTASAGTVAVKGTASITLDAVTTAATGTVAVQGTASITLDDTTVSAAGTVAVQGTASITLDDVTTAADGAVTGGITGTASITLDDVTTSSAGLVADAGAALTYLVELDTLRDGSYAGTYDDITAYVTTMNWRNGMSDAYQEVDTTGAQASFTIKDASGVWRQDWRGSEVLTNGGFTAWTTDNPDSWTVVGESGSDPYVNEVGKSELHGGTGTGSCNLYTTGTTLSIRQSALTVGTRYEVILDIDTVDDTLAGGIYVQCGSTNVSKLYQLPGVKRLFFTATDTSFRIETLGSCDVTINSVSVLPTQRYCGVLNKETLIRVRAQAPGGAVTTLYIGQVVDALPTLGEIGKREITINALCPMQQLLDLEYQPSLLLDTTADAVISEIFDSAELPYPYSYRFWRLGAEGCSTLGVSTITYSHDVTMFDTGNTSFPYAGDAENQTGRGTSAQGVIQSMMAAELGRFFFNTRTAQFTLHNRARDTLNDASVESLTFSDFWEMDTASDDVKNIITVNYEPREVGAVGEVIWTATGLPLKLEAGINKEIQARYVDPDSDKPMGAMDFIYPELSVDYIVNSSEDGTGSDVTDTVTVAAEFGGSSAKVWLSTSAVCYVTTLQLRGTPLRRFDRQAVTVSDGDSIYDNGEQPAPPVELPAVSSEDYAREIGNYLLARYANRTTRLKAARFAMGYEATTAATRAIARAPGDRITITDAWSQHDQDYFIVGEEHTVTAGSAELWSVRWHLRPASREIFWRVGTSGYSETGITTRLSL